MPYQKFSIGRLVITANAAATLTGADVTRAVRRHATGDWGDLDAEDRQINEASLSDGGRLFSAYAAGDGTKFWVITEADRSATTVLLPEEY